MKVAVEIPEGKFCTRCPFLQEVVVSWGMEKSKMLCAYLKKDIPFNDYKQKWVRKHVVCPSH